MRLENSRSILDNSGTISTHIAYREENSAFDFTVCNEVDPHIEYDDSGPPLDEDLDLDV